MKVTPHKHALNFFINRYLKHPKLYLFRFSFVFMVFGIVISVGILSAGLNLFEGYERTLKTLLLDSIPHISIQSYRNQYISKDDITQIKSKVESLPQIDQINPILSSSVMASKSGVIRGCQLKAYEYKTNPPPYEKYITVGRSEVMDSEIIIGYYLAKELSISVGDTLNVVYPQFDRITALGFYPNSRNYTVCGVYQSGYYENDRNLIITSKSNADELLLTQDKYSYIEIRLNPKYVNDADRISREVESLLGSSFVAIPWSTYNQGLFRLIVVEKWLIFIIFSFLVLIAGLNVISAITTIMYEKKNEIAILKTLGANNELIQGIFYYRVALVSILSILIGQVFGFILSLIVVKQSFYSLKGDVYFIDRLVMYVSPLNQIIIFLCASILIMVCIGIPLRSINKIEIIDILRQK